MSSSSARSQNARSRWAGSGRTIPILLAAAALTVLPLALATSPAQADVEDFSYDRWNVEYDLGLDDDGRAVAHVTEELTARFPQHDQNRGIVRSIPRDYQGASTDPRDITVTDGSGAAVPFEVERGSDDSSDEPYVAILTGDADYVHGAQTYVIEYTLSDVVLARDDETADEFYWDLVPSARQQPISSFSGTIRFAPELAEHFTGSQRCYAGVASSSDECSIREFAGEVGIGPMPLDASEGVTVAVGLDPGTVVQPSQRVPNFAFDGVPIIVGGLGLAASAAGTIAAGVLASRRKNGGRGTVIPQYEVPRSLPPLIAGSILGSSRDPFAAQVVHLAVNGVVRFEEAPGEQRRKKKPKLAVRLVDPFRCDDSQDRATVSALFPSGEPGELVDLSKRDESLVKRVAAVKSGATETALKRGYFTKERSRIGRILGFIALGIIAVLAVLLVVAFIVRGAHAGPVIGLVIGVIALVFVFPAVLKHRVHTREGAETREYLEGARMFIKVAEADRLQMLQSYAGAERLESGSVNVIHLYERLLPYAMLFGLEREWGGVLESWYRANPDTTVGWYPYMAGQGFGGIGDSVSDMVSAISNSVSYSSSSSGGSTGGGSVGGGGGGGAAGGR